MSIKAPTMFVAYIRIADGQLATINWVSWLNMLYVVSVSGSSSDIRLN